ncbi:MAG: FAD-dependent oxidoreductase [Verrucomicrobiaceae bacterium]|nr:FAD-dependent oxidoreductase [Verrucomicrobiaceae bacterium]
MDRRAFLSTFVSTSALGFAGCSGIKSSSKSDVEAEFDVVVVGGGTAGTIAAIQSARLGAKTLVIERSSQLGGTTTTAGVNFPGLFHIGSRQIIAGIGWELVCKSIAENGDKLPEFKPRKRHWRNQVKLNEYLYACLAEEELIKAKGNILYYSYPKKIEKTANGFKIFVCSDCGEGYIFTKKIVDATGSASACALAGFERITSENRQPGTLIFELTGLDKSKINYKVLRKALKDASLTGELGKRDIWNIGGLVEENGFNSLYVQNADNSTPVNFTQTNIEGRKVFMRLFRFLKRQHGFENIKVKNIKTEVGVRETYRVLGERILSVDDYRAGKIFEDSLCYSYYPTDLHDMKGLKTVQQKEGVAPTIPLSALTPKGAENILVAGRCVSSDRLANSALRVQASCMAMGQVAGCVSALASLSNKKNSEVDLTLIKKTLIKHRAIVPQVNG